MSMHAICTSARITIVYREVAKVINFVENLESVLKKVLEEV
jgi:mevalonate pyrophosphate decarboxylase